MNVDLTWAFTAGMVAAVNPCGFPMLPAYLSWFIGIEDEGDDRASRVPRAIAAALAVSAGFFAVFAALGLPVNAGVTELYRLMPWLTIVIGAVLVAAGLAMLAGRRLVPTLPRLERGGRSRRTGSMVLYGASYAVASLGCTLPLFLVVVAGTTERESPLSGAAAFAAFASGTTLVLTTVSLALALARDGMVRWIRSVLPYVDRIAGALLVVVGAYLVLYGVEAIRDDDAASSPVAAVERWSSDAAAWLEEGGTTVGLAMAVVVAVAAGWTAVRCRGRSGSSG